MKTALITGDVGFVGSNMREALDAAGWTTTGIDIRRNGTDVRDFFRSDETTYDLVIHAAAVVGGRAMIEGAPLSVAVDLSIDAELFGWAIKTKPGRVVYYSSSAAYPIRLQSREAQLAMVEEMIDMSGIQTPDLTYGWAKLTGEMLAGYARKAGVPVTILRPFSGYGEGQDLDYPWPSFVKRARDRKDPFIIWGDGRQIRDWIHISDVVGATMACIDQEIDGPLNIGTGRPTTFRKLARICCDAAGYSPQFTYNVEAPTGVQYRVADTAHLFHVYQPKVTLEDAIAKALA